MVFGFNNFKGGSGKTFSLLNIARGLARKNKKILIIDLDPQGNSSFKCFDNYEEINGADKVVNGEMKLSDVIRKTPFENIDIVVGNYNLEDSITFDMDIDGRTRKVLSEIEDLKVFADQIYEIKSQYDYILIDNNPYIGLFLEFTAFIADWIIVPVNSDFNSLKGVDRTVDKIIRVIESAVEAGDDLNVDFKILLNNVPKNTKDGNNFVKEVKNAYQDVVFETVIRHQAAPAGKQAIKQQYFAIDHLNTSIGQELSDLVNEIERSL